MNRQQYIAALQQALRGLYRVNQDEIVREIEAHMGEMPSGEHALLERFGTPEALARRYLEGEAPPPRLGARIRRVGVKALAVLGIATLLVLAAISAFILYWSQDAFDYADERAAELSEQDRHWQRVDWREPVTIDLKQSRLVVYWHDEDQLRWRCQSDGEQVALERGRLEIRQHDCLVFLSSQPLMLVAAQADVVLVRPQRDAHIELTWGRLRIAAGETGYRYGHLEKQRFLRECKEAPHGEPQYT